MEPNALPAMAEKPTPPATRDLRQPYYLLRTPDRVGSYFTPEVYAALLGEAEPLAQFLAPARMLRPEGKKYDQIVYELSSYPLETFRPLEYLLEPEVKAFEAAARAFYERARPGTPKVATMEKDLRKAFRLPDPDKERDAYWVYGPEEAPKLLILWGAEFREGTSLPLMAELELGLAAPTVADRLRAKLMPWDVVQRKALEIALRPDEPLSRFLALPATTKDKAGAEVPAWKVGPETVPASACAPAGKFSAAGVQAFRAAAQSYYAKAQPEAGRPEFERTLRAQLVLPHPEHDTAAVLTGPGGKPLLRAAPPASPATAAALCATPVAEGSAQRNLADWMAGQVVKQGPLIAVAVAVAAVLLGVGAYVLIALPDRTPPRVVAIDEPAMTATRVAVEFSEALDPASLTAEVEAGGRKRKPVEFEGTGAEVAAIELDPANPKRVVLTTANALTDGGAYSLSIVGLKDKAGNPMAEAASEAFTFRDRTPQIVEQFSAYGDDPRRALLRFAKPVKASSLRGADKVSIESLGGTGGTLRVATLAVESELDPSGKTVVVSLGGGESFVPKRIYRIVVTGITDLASEPNEVLPDQGINGQQVAFVDTFPPRLKGGVLASAVSGELQLSFSKPVDPKTATNPANFVLKDPKGETLETLPSSFKLDDQGLNLTFRLAPGRRQRGEHTLTVNGVTDLGSPANTIKETTETFLYGDEGTIQPPTSIIVRERGGSDNLPRGGDLGIMIEFPSAPVIATVKAENFALTRQDPAGRLPVAIRTVSPAGTEGRLYRVELAEALQAASAHALEIKGVEDVFGTSVTITANFQTGGILDLTSQVQLGVTSDLKAEGAVVKFTTREGVRITVESATNARNFKVTMPSGEPAGVTVVGVKVSVPPPSGAFGGHEWEVTLSGPPPEGAMLEAFDLVHDAGTRSRKFRIAPTEITK